VVIELFGIGADQSHAQMQDYRRQPDHEQPEKNAGIRAGAIRIYILNLQIIIKRRISLCTLLLNSSNAIRRIKIIILLLDEVFKAVGFTRSHSGNVEDSSGYHCDVHAPDYLAALEHAGLVEKRQNEWNKQNALDKVDEAVVE